MSKVEVGKSYLVFLKEDNEIYEGLSITGFFMKEYDKDTKSIKIKDEIWEKIEDNLLVKQALQN